jgi:hypothetical protein
MYTKAKYIVGDINGTYMSHTCAVVFSEAIGHDEVAKVFIPGTIVSAGFCHATEEKVWVYGESISLHIKSNPERDETLVGRAIAHPAYVLM